MCWKYSSATQRLVAGFLPTIEGRIVNKYQEYMTAYSILYDIYMDFPAGRRQGYTCTYRHD